MKCIEVSMFEMSPAEALQLADGVPVLIYDTLFQNYKIVKSSNNAIYLNPDFDEERYVLLLFSTPIYKNSKKKVKRNVN